MRPEGARSTTTAACVVVGALAAAWAAWVFRGYSVDDAFITYRVAEHIARGDGFVYNAGERAQVTTTPLWALLLALLGRAGAPVPAAATVVSSALLLGAAALVPALGTAPPQGAILPLAAFAFVPCHFFLLSCLGMETALYLALACGAIALAERGHAVAAGTAAALLALARADGVLLLPLLALGALRRRDRSAVAGLVPVALIGAAWLLFGTLYFGQPLPTTLQAKIAQGRSGLWGPAPVFARGIGRWLGGVARESRLFWCVPALAIVGLARGPRGLRTLGAFAASVTAGYALLDVPDYHWYYAPLVFALLASAAWGVALLPRREAAIALLLALAWANVRTTAQRSGMFPLPARIAYEGVGRVLRHHAGATVAAAEIGVLGHAAGTRMCDWVGIACPGAAPLLAARRLDRFLGDFRPDLVVVHEPLWPVEEPLFSGAGARRYAFAGAYHAAGLTLVVLERGEPPAIAAAAAIPGPLDLDPGHPSRLPLPPLDARVLGSLRIEARAPRGAKATLVLRWTSDAVRAMRDPYRIDVPLAGDGEVHGYDVPIAGDARLMAFGRLTSMAIDAQGAPVHVAALSFAPAP